VRSPWSLTSIPVSRNFDVSEFPQMDLRFEATNGIISCRTDQIRASVLTHRVQRYPACGPLDATLTLFRFGCNTLRHYFDIIFGIHLQMNGLDGSGGAWITQGSSATTR